MSCTEEWLERGKWWVVFGVVLWVAEADERIVANKVYVDWIRRVEWRGRFGDGGGFVAVVGLFGEADVDGYVGYFAPCKRWCCAQMS